MTLDELGKRWERAIAAIDIADPKARVGPVLEALERLLREDCSKEDRRRLLAEAAARPDDRIAWATIGGLIGASMRLGDREALILVLATACPRTVAFRDVEGYVVLPWDGSRITEPLTVFFEAYAKSESEEARRTIAGAMRRGFAFTGPLPEGDDELMRWCERWYQEHKGRIEFNLEYGDNFAEGGGYAENGLFVVRE